MQADAAHTIAQTAGLIARRQISPVELVEQCLAQAALWEAHIHSFITLEAESAIAAAKRAEAEIMKNGARGPLHGIPLGIKDVVHVEDMGTTAASALRRSHVAKRDAAVVDKLKASGAVILGKTNTHEFAYGGPSFDLPWPPARNPWDTSRFTGGSSSGNAAAIAAGVMPGGIGTDTSGSVRSPASLCGIAGLKPTYGLVSRRGCLPLAHSLDHVGPMARTAQDCAILLDAIAGHDPRDPASVFRPDGSFHQDGAALPKPLKIGVVRHFFEADLPVSQDTLAALDGMLAVFMNLGAAVRDVRLSALQEWDAAGSVILLAEAYALHRKTLREAPEQYGASMRDRITMGAFISAADYLDALCRRSTLCGELEQAMADLDLLISPTQYGEAPQMERVEKWASFEIPSYCVLFNLTGYPAVSICAGFGPHGMPLGLQLVAKPFQENLLLQAAHMYERETGWHLRRPPLPA